MKTLSAGLQAHLDTGTTTMCYCWRITRKDGDVSGYTEHDKDLVVDGTSFMAEGGFSASLAQQALGLSVDNMELVGGFNLLHISESDILSGLYHDAEVEIMNVNWQDPTQFMILMAGNLGEMSRSGVEFTAELRSLSHRLNQKIGRTFLRSCDAVFCDVNSIDRRCRLLAVDHTETGTVLVATSRSGFTSSDLPGASKQFSRGVITWLTGANAGATADVRTQTKLDGISVFDNWTTLAFDVQPGDTFSVLSGCRQNPKACKSFGNYNNYQGFPHMPGKDIITVYAEQGGSGQDGGKR